MYQLVIIYCSSDHGLLLGKACHHGLQCAGVYYALLQHVLVLVRQAAEAWRQATAAEKAPHVAEAGLEKKVCEKLHAEYQAKKKTAAVQCR